MKDEGPTKGWFQLLPPGVDVETKQILKKVNEANRELATLKGYARIIPNQNILIRALALQEAKESSGIESIITTTDELYKAEILKHAISPQTKEVQNYIAALLHGFQVIKDHQMLTINHICSIQKILERNDAGVRRQMGTVLKNATTGDTVYTPPQHPDELMRLIGNFEDVLNLEDAWPEVDTLIKMAVLHFQFESIHPFYDGNGRTGRILNVLYLVLKGLLDAPILYLSHYIICHKGEYYQRFYEAQQHHHLEPFILFMLTAIIETSRLTTEIIRQIDHAMLETKREIKAHFKFYSRDLNEALYLYPYTKIQHLQTHLKIARNTARLYLEKLTEQGIMERVKVGHHLYFVNKRLFAILSAITIPVDPSTPMIVTSASLQ